MQLPRLSSIAFVLAISACPACSLLAQDSSTTATLQQTTPQQTTPSGEKRPQDLPQGINDGFLDPKMDIDQWVKRFEVESREVVACQREIAKAIQLSPGASVADIGSGTGLYLAAMSKLVGNSGKVYAVDISPTFVKHLRVRAKDEGLKNVQVVMCSDRHVKLKPASIDRAFICDVYHHFEFPNSSLESIYDALRPGGKLILVDFHKEIAGPRREWMMNHIRAPKEVFQQEIIDAGFQLESEVKVPGFKENYLLRFTKATK